MRDDYRVWIIYSKLFNLMGLKFRFYVTVLANTLLNPTLL